MKITTASNYSCEVVNLWLFIWVLLAVLILWTVWSSNVLLNVVTILLLGLFTYILFVNTRDCKKHVEKFEMHKWRLVFLTIDNCTWCDREQETFDKMVAKHADELRKMNVVPEVLIASSGDERTLPLVKYARNTSFPVVLMVSQVNPQLIKTLKAEREEDVMWKKIKEISVSEFYINDN